MASVAHPPKPSRSKSHADAKAAKPCGLIGQQLGSSINSLTCSSGKVTVSNKLPATANSRPKLSEIQSSPQPHGMKVGGFDSAFFRAAASHRYFAVDTKPDACGTFTLNTSGTQLSHHQPEYTMLESFNFRKPPENPEKIAQFRQTLEKLNGLQDQRASLKMLFDAVDKLAEAELNYYYRRRLTRSTISTITRFAGWMFGTLGIVSPLLSTSVPNVFGMLSPYGYALLACAASALAANSLFAGTEGHIRFVTTQLEIEKLIVASRINWCQFLMTNQSTPLNVDEAFELLNAYASTLHNMALKETQHWGETITGELQKYQQMINKSHSVIADKKAQAHPKAP